MEDRLDKLERLERLRESKAITDAEFENEKQKLLQPTNSIDDDKKGYYVNSHNKTKEKTFYGRLIIFSISAIVIALPITTYIYNRYRNQQSSDISVSREAINCRQEPSGNSDIIITLAETYTTTVNKSNSSWSNIVVANENCWVRNSGISKNLIHHNVQSDLKFENYAALPVSLRTVYPDFSGRDRESAMFRTRIREAMSEGPNFAGTYTLLQFGCGTECTFVIVANNETGEVIWFPRGGEYNLQLTLKYKLNSRLLKAHWFNYDADTCYSEEYILNKNTISLISSKKIGSADYCRNMSE